MSWHLRISSWPRRIRKGIYKCRYKPRNYGLLSKVVVNSLTTRIFSRFVKMRRHHEKSNQLVLFWQRMRSHRSQWSHLVEGNGCEHLSLFLSCSSSLQLRECFFSDSQVSPSSQQPVFPNSNSIRILRVTGLTTTIDRLCHQKNSLTSKSIRPEQTTLVLITIGTQPTWNDILGEFCRVISLKEEFS